METLHPLQTLEGDHRIFVRNTFLEVQDQDDLDHKQMLKRSNSWSASSSSDVDPSSVDDFLVPQQPQLRPEHVVWHDSSETTSESAASTAHGRVSMEEKIRMEKVAAVQAKIRELTQSDPMLGEDGPPPEIVYGWSQGSANHDNGKCTPCIHFTTRAGCKHAEACRFCHLEHGEDARRGRHRPCKATRNQCKQLLAQMNDLYKDDPEQKQQAYLKLAQQSPYMKSLLKGVLDSEDTEAAASSTAPRPPGLQDEDRKGSGPSPGRKNGGRKNLISL